MFVFPKSSEILMSTPFNLDRLELPADLVAFNSCIDASQKSHVWCRAVALLRGAALQRLQLDVVSVSSCVSAMASCNLGPRGIVCLSG